MPILLIMVLEIEDCCKMLDSFLLPQNHTDIEGFTSC